jgi:hypothetical protein
MRYEIPRESARLVTGGPTTDPLLAKDGSHPARVAKVTRVGVHLATGDEGVLREGRVRHLASQGVRVVNGSKTASSRSSSRRPLGGSGGQGQEGAGCRREGARARRSTDVAQKVTHQSWRLAHTSAHEAFGELGRRPTVMRGVL